MTSGVRKILAIALLVALPAAAQSQGTEDERRYHDLIEELRCLVCQNQSIAESNAPLAEDLRRQVRAQIAAGRSDAEIAEFLTDRYGDFVLYRPPFKARTWLLWLGPFVVLAGAVGAAAWYVRRIRASAPPLEGPEAEPPQPAPAAATGAVPRLGAVEYGAAALALLVFAAVWYALSGSWRTQALVELARTHPEAARAAASEASIERLRDHLADNPQDAESWSWLARAEILAGRYAEAAQAYARANQLSGSRNPDWLVEEGEALAAIHGRNLAGAPAEKFAAALEIAPDHPRALWFAGLAALQAQDEAGAIRSWERLLAQDLPADVREALAARVSAMRQGSGAPAPARTAGPRLQLRIELAPELAGSVEPGAVLLVYALEPGGPRMPVAVQRLPAGDFPLTVTLDDSNSMLAGRKLSAFERWTVLARISATGDAQPRAGDLQGRLELSADQAGQLHRLRIDTRIE